MEMETILIGIGSGNRVVDYLVLGLVTIIVIGIGIKSSSGVCDRCM